MTTFPTSEIGDRLVNNKFLPFMFYYIHIRTHQEEFAFNIGPFLYLMDRHVGTQQYNAPNSNSFCVTSELGTHQPTLSTMLYLSP